MLLVLIRTIIIYFIVLFTVRLMGKSELSKTSPFQMVVLFMIAELASIPIDSPDVPILTGITAISSLLFLQVVISYLSIKSERFNTFINGKPSILISKGKINEVELTAQRISINDLTEQLRLAGTPSLNDVDYAIMESNGSLSVILRPEKQPLTPSDIDVARPVSSLPLVVVSDGSLYKENLLNIGYTEIDLLDELKGVGCNSLEDVFMVFSDESANLHIYKRNGDGIIEEVHR